MPEMLTPGMVIKQLSHIHSVLNGPLRGPLRDATVHEMEDRLRHYVLEHIAAGTAQDPKRCARLALATDGMDFERQYE